MQITLKAARVMRNKSQADTAAVIGVERTCYGKLEKEPKKLTIEQASKICIALKVRSEDIIGLDIHSITE